ncbi:Elongation of very long chain fatty acids protein 7 [Halotydeus destructor]|nr:Elongation of very long chain fatty acids protein 7 [Halotydeus destructor]
MATELFKSWLNWARYVHHDMWELYAKPQANDFPLVAGGPWTVVTAVALYLTLSTFIGPLYMADRKPLPLKVPVIFFDLLMVLCNSSIVLIGLGISNFGLDTWFSRSEVFDAKYGQLPYYVGYAYFVSKFLDFLETMFYVLKKNRRKVSLLHLYHHSVMPFVAWTGLKYVPCPLSGWVVGVNSSVHALLYLYYAISAAGYKMDVRLKQALAALQLCQFVSVSLHGIYILVFLSGPGNHYPPLLAAGEVLLGGSFLTLFAHSFVLE